MVCAPAIARGLSLSTGAQTMLYLSLKTSLLFYALCCKHDLKPHSHAQINSREYNLLFRFFKKGSCQLLAKV